MNNKFDKTIDIIQQWLIWFIIGVITFCIAVLFLFDVLAGTGTMLFLTGGKEWQSVVISLATTGLLFALMFIGYMLMENKSGFIKQVGIFILIIASLIYIEDIIFDALLADILRYGSIIAPSDTSVIQWMFRFLLGGISTVGDALAIAMILGLPVLKSIIGKSINNDGNPQQNHPRTQNQPRNVPQSIPRNNNTPIPGVSYSTRPAPRPVRQKQNYPEPNYHPISFKNLNEEGE